MSKKLLALILIGILIVVAIGLFLMTQRKPTESPTTQEAEALEETTQNNTKSDGIPTEFEDNLDQAFEDLDAIDL